MLRQKGMYFYFPNKGEAPKLMIFLETLVPTQVHSRKKTINADVKSNFSNYKHTNMVEISLVYKNDIILLSQKLLTMLSTSNIESYWGLF